MGVTSIFVFLNTAKVNIDERKSDTKLPSPG